MQILVTGRGTSGSWRVRGEQLGAAIGARVQPRCLDLRGADLIVWVKRLMAVPLKGRFWVWDIVDAWPQPVGNAWDEAHAVSWLREELERHRPSAVVFPTTAMLEDSAWRGPALVLPHHAWPKYRRRAPRESGRLVVGYEGSMKHLGRWAEVLKRACRARGWRFSANEDLSACDIGVALRECAGHAPRRWKSNVKLANLQALGIPAICSPEQGYTEFGSGAELYVETPDELASALEQCASLELRARAGARMAAAAPTLVAVAEKYRAWLAQLNS